MSNNCGINDENIDAIHKLVDKLSTKIIEEQKQLSLMGENKNEDEFFDKELADNIYDLLVPDHDSSGDEEIRERLELTKHNLSSKLYPDIYEIHKDSNIYKLISLIEKLVKILVGELDVESIYMKPVVDEFKYITFICVIEGLTYKYGCKKPKCLQDFKFLEFLSSATLYRTKNLSDGQILSYHYNDTSISINECSCPFTFSQINNIPVIDSNLIAENDDGSASIDDICVTSTLNNQVMENNNDSLINTDDSIEIDEDIYITSHNQCNL